MKRGRPYMPGCGRFTLHSWHASHDAGLSVRGRSHGRAGQAPGAVHHGSSEAATPAVQEVVKGLQLCAGSRRFRVTIVAELAASLASRTLDNYGYSGAVPVRTQRPANATAEHYKNGNAHLRRIVVEAAWSYRHGQPLAPGCANDKKECRNPSRRSLGKAQVRLTKRYARLARAGKDQRKIITAVGRELLASSGPSASKRKLPANCDGSLTKCKDKRKAKAKTFQRMKKQKPATMNSSTQFEDRASRSRASTKENPRLPYATGTAGLATLVRADSRRIKIMRFRPANIRLINRRSLLPWLLLPCPRTKQKQRQQQKQPHPMCKVDGVTPYQGISA